MFDLSLFENRVCVSMRKLLIVLSALVAFAGTAGAQHHGNYVPGNHVPGHHHGNNFRGGVGYNRGYYYGSAFPFNSVYYGGAYTVQGANTYFGPNVVLDENGIPIPVDPFYVAPSYSYGYSYFPSYTTRGLFYSNGFRGNVGHYYYSGGHRR